MRSPLFAYPPQAEFNRPVPKTKVYQHAGTFRRIRDAFVREVDQIVWKYKLAPETTNLPHAATVPEIEILSVALRTPTASEAVLRTIDKAIPLPVIFELSFQGQVKSTAAYKRPSDADPSKWVVDAYFESPWLPANHPRDPLPIALDLAGLYEQLLLRLLPIAPRRGELLRSLVERANQIRVKEIERDQLTIRLHQEIQFNRKVDLNRQLRTLDQELKRLKDANCETNAEEATTPGTYTTRTATWKR
jgi:hypothetical protein